MSLRHSPIVRDIAPWPAEDWIRPSAIGTDRDISSVCGEMIDLQKTDLGSAGDREFIDLRCTGSVCRRPTMGRPETKTTSVSGEMIDLLKTDLGQPETEISSISGARIDLLEADRDHLIGLL